MSSSDNHIGDFLRYVLLSMIFGTGLVLAGLAWFTSWRSGAAMLPIGAGCFWTLGIFLEAAREASRKLRLERRRSKPW